MLPWQLYEVEVLKLLKLNWNKNKKLENDKSFKLKWKLA